MINQASGLSGRQAAVRRCNSETVRSFIVDRCQIAAHFGERHKDDLRAACVRWCDRNDETPISELAFCKALIEIGYTERPSALIRGWMGLRLM
jgi:hypothetical protein